MIVGMQHDHDVGARAEGFAIAGLLVAAVPVIAVMNVHLEPKLARHMDGRVGTSVVYNNDDFIFKVNRFAVTHEFPEPLLQ